MNRVKKAFDIITAEDRLKQNTISFLKEERAKRDRGFKRIYRYAAACAVLVAVVFGVNGYSFLNTAVSYISIDVNPSIELALNRINNVVEVSAYNDDGSKILKELDLEGKDYTEAIDILLSNEEFISYLSGNDRINFTVVSNKQDEIINGIEGCKGYGQNNGYCRGADSEIASKAHECGLSIGKYRAYIELVQYDETVTVEDCRNMTMRQIRNKIDEYSENAESLQLHHGYGKGHHRNHEN